jgi:hypothetical protein
MKKAIVILLSLAGAAYLMAVYAPQAYSHGVAAQGYTIPFALFALGGVLFLSWGLKSK